METATMITIGDIVSLKSHAYVQDVGSVIITGEPLYIPPMMIVIDIFNTGKDKTSIEYICLWFSSKMNKFERTRVKGEFIKLLFKRQAIIDPEILSPGTLVSLTTLSYELAKKKSSYHAEYNFANGNRDNSSISSLLSFLPPLLHCITVKEVTPKTSTKKEKANSVKTKYEVKCMWFNSSFEKLSEETLPIEALKIIPIIKEKTILELTDSIKLNKTIKIISDQHIHLIKPKSINARSGYYFLNGYDYQENQIKEILLTDNYTLELLDTPFLNSTPKFDIKNNPQSSNVQFIIDELIQAIKQSFDDKSYIRIKYKNRNDQLTIRTIRNYEIVDALEEGNSVQYLIGHCLLRKSLRTFKLSRIMNFQQLDIQFA